MLLAALNDLDIQMTDIGNTYLTAPIMEKCYVVAGGEFGLALKGRTLKIVRDLYGLKSSGAAFRSHLASILCESLDFMACQADPDVWMHRANKADVTPYYKYILVYVDDVMAISGNPNGIIIASLHNHFLLKVVSNPGKEPDRCLGSMIGKYQFTDGSVAWYMSADDYLSKAIPTVEEGCDDKLYKKHKSPLPLDYYLKVDTLPLLDDGGTSLYTSYIGILQWAVELGHIDLPHSVSLMSRFRNAPQ
jgi:hypothetical protein